MKKFGAKAEVYLAGALEGIALECLSRLAAEGRSDAFGSEWDLADLVRGTELEGFLPDLGKKPNPDQALELVHDKLDEESQSALDDAAREAGTSTEEETENALRESLIEIGFHDCEMVRDAAKEAQGSFNMAVKTLVHRERLDHAWKPEWDSVIDDLKTVGFEDVWSVKDAIVQTQGNLNSAVRLLVSREREMRIQAQRLN